MKEKVELVDVQDFSKELITQLKRRKNIITTPRQHKIFKGRLDETAVLMLSDIHSGQKNSFLDPGEKQPHTTYDTEIMFEQGNRLIDGVETINRLLSHSYKLDKLYIFGLGDLVENDVIFKGQRFFIDKAVGYQLRDLVDLLANTITRLLETFREIEFINVIGNHGRFGEKEASPAVNSFDFIAGQMLQLMFRDEPRVKITLPESWYYFVDIYGWRYFLHHGDTVYSWMSLPYYGLKRQGTARRIETPFDIECIGHFHHSMEIPISGGSKTFVNGSWIPKSDYGWRKFGVISRPEQYYFGVSPKRARSWGWNIDLLPSRNEDKKDTK